MSSLGSGSFQLILNGGLGNQLFGYAAGRSIEVSSGLECRYLAPGKNDRALELHNFGINTFSEPYFKSNPLTRSLSNRLLNRVSKQRFRYSETSFRFDERFYKSPQGHTLRGYFQSHLYHKNIESELLQLPSMHVEFTEQFLNLADSWGNANYIAVHVRRGDYIGKESYHGLASRDYLSAARDKILELKPDAKFVVFSDSIEIAKRDFPYAEKYISSDDLSKPSENLLLMARMGGLIGSNSSLSWWAGFLNQNVSMNFFPDPWFSSPQLDTQDLLPERWNKIPSGI